MIKKVNFFIRDYFAFSRTETRGLFFLLSVVCLLILLTLYVEKTAFATYEERQSDLLILDSLWLALEKVQIEETVPVEVLEKELFLFDPNQASLEDFLLLGLDEKLSNRIINFRNKGGKFNKPEDMLRIYNFSPSIYEELRPYIYLPAKKEHKKSISESRLSEVPDRTEKTEINVTEKERFLVDLNEADSLRLSMLKGVGPVLSSRIIKYRDQLGGFYSKAQLKEIYKISELALSSLEEYGYIREDFTPHTIKINEVDFKTLLKHPYIDYELAQAIMNHRRIYGNFSSPEQLREVYHMQEELLVKLLPYIVI